jgi:hypothetical protein
MDLLVGSDIDIVLGTDRTMNLWPSDARWWWGCLERCKLLLLLGQFGLDGCKQFRLASEFLDRIGQLGNLGLKLGDWVGHSKPHSRGTFTLQ